MNDWNPGETRPQPSYTPGQPPHPFFQPAPKPTPSQQRPVYTPVVPAYAPQHAPQHAPARRRPNRRRLIGLAIVGAAVVTLIAVIATSLGSSSPAYVSQLKNDGYTLVHSGTVHGGEGVGYAYGSNAQGAGELVLQFKSAVNASAEAASFQQAGFTGAAVGDLLVLDDPSYSDLYAAIKENFPSWTP